MNETGQRPLGSDDGHDLGQHPPEVATMIRLVKELGERTGKKKQYEQADALGVNPKTYSRYLNGDIPPDDRWADMLDRAQIPGNEREEHLRARLRAAQARATTAQPATASAHQVADPAEVISLPPDRQPSVGGAVPQGAAPASPGSAAQGSGHIAPAQPVRRPGEAALRVTADITHVLDRKTTAIVLLAMTVAALTTAIFVMTTRASTETSANPGPVQQPTATISPSTTITTPPAKTRRSDPPSQHIPTASGPTQETIQPPAPTNAQPHSPDPAGSCHWKVIWPTAGLYEEPTRDQPALTSKKNGDEVGPYCTIHYNASENENYVKVQTDKAADGIGWMRTSALKRSG